MAAQDKCYTIVPYFKVLSDKLEAVLTGLQSYYYWSKYIVYGQSQPFLGRDTKIII